MSHTVQIKGTFAILLLLLPFLSHQTTFQHHNGLITKSYDKMPRYLLAAAGLASVAMAIPATTFKTVTTTIEVTETATPMATVVERHEIASYVSPILVVRLNTTCEPYVWLTV